MKTQTEELAALVDGEVDAETRVRLEAAMAADPELAARYRDQVEARTAFREGYEEPRLPVAEDYLVGRVMAEIRRLEGGHQTQETPWKSLFAGLWAPVIAGGLAVVLLVFALLQPGHSRHARVLQARSWQQNVSVTPFVSRDADVTVIWVEGLDYLPKNNNIVDDNHS